MASPVVVRVRVEAVSLCNRSKPTTVLTITMYVTPESWVETSTLMSEVVMLCDVAPGVSAAITML